MKINIVYIVVFLITIAFFGLYWFKFQTYLKDAQNIKSLQLQVEDLRQKEQIINTFRSTQLDSLIKTLNTLLPGKEDYFSIFTSLDNVSRTSGFVITSYSVSFSKASPEKVGLIINGEGTPGELMKFIENYKFSGGRLITMDSVEFSPSTTQTALKVNFYAKNTVVPNSANVRINTQTFDLINSINSKFNEGILDQGNISSSEAEQSGSFIPKEDPFQ
jgi:hypothetical protein